MTHDIWSSTLVSGTRKTADKARPGVKGWLRRLLVFGTVSAVVAVAIFFFAYQRTEIPSPNAAYQSQSTYVYYAGGKQRLGTFAQQNRESLPLAEIPDSMQDAVVAAEDRTFWTNKGLDPKGILRAAFSNAQGNATQGASTITQQYVKLLYLTQERTLKRKIKEAFLSLKIQQQQSKQEILQGYLNTIYFGRGAYGVEAAARAYFGIGARDLKPAQSAMLAAIVKNPNYYEPDPKAESYDDFLARFRYVVQGMTDMGTLSKPVDTSKLPKTVKRDVSDTYGGQKGFMLTMVKSQLRGLGFTDEQIEAGGLRVTTTLTRKGMRAAQRGVREESPDGLRGLHVAAASVDVKTGGLIGFYAGQDYLKSQINWATTGNSPGSTFKAFAVAAGLKDGFSLKSTFEGNSPLVIGDAEIENQGESGGTDLGSAISLLTATQKSVNTAFVDLTDAMPDGANKVKEMAIDLGIPEDAPGLEPVLTVSLGSATVSPIAMANAYATIANRGKRNDWYLIKSVKRASDGKVLWKHKRDTERAVSEDIADDTSYALQQTANSGTATKALGLGRPVAGKTGTATKTGGDVVSSWFVGYTPQISTAVMYTRGNGRKSLNNWLVPFYGGTYPANTWLNIMRTLHEDLEVEDFPPPANLVADPPTSGHEPYVPPPPPKPKPKPKKEKKPKPSKTPTPKPSPPATPPPTTEPSDGTGGGNGNGNGNGNSPDPSPSPLLGG